MKEWHEEEQENYIGVDRKNEIKKHLKGKKDGRKGIQKYVKKGKESCIERMK